MARMVVGEPEYVKGKYKLHMIKEVSTLRSNSFCRIQNSKLTFGAID